MSRPVTFKIEKKGKDQLARAGILHTKKGDIHTPAFVVVGTKATVKALTPEQVKTLGAQVVLGNTYHLFLQPGENLVNKQGGLGAFMNWSGPTITDSGGFQVFSLGDAFGNHVTKFVSREMSEEDKPMVYNKELATQHGRLAVVDDEGVTFTSHIDGSMHRFTPERSIEIQQKLGADMIFSFDECTSPTAPYEYQKEAMERTHAWAERGLKAHRLNVEANRTQGLFGIVQGGRYQDLRVESAKTVASMDFDGFGIGGSFTKEDLFAILRQVNENLPEEKPRHLLGIGEPEDLFIGVLNGCDLFDCVAPTRLGRTGTLYTKEGKINIENAQYKDDVSAIEDDCECYTCRNYSKAYIAHLFRSKEMLAATLASIHNLYFIIHLMKNIREAVMGDRLEEYKDEFLGRYS